ncbi:phage tail tape measure protein [Halodesulfovibrio marinisediminis]|uniref:Phage tail tape measure protein, TP901 family, core region n=1 Tax=Halodesulfovibrio marinisediminis DSM 17456 TaxID=1121457 RepID=A0A1N6DQ71_9BACT|nr:phage tail tape measure protein [Halodesulfovibrio marinisediminis]SIN72867.1 phage tail tape measure protein, TP901 family, core region [Halodesulfovibrio marinisediminis DSM 17456]
MEKLFFKLGLKDDVTGPVGKIQKELDGLAGSAQKSFTQVGVGVAGMWGAAQGIDAMLSPAREMNKALAEVGSLDVNGAALGKLNSAALEFSIDYGVAADAVAASAYDIQSSIAGLTGDELASFTRASNVLAKATKADAATVTDYTGTMFGIFKAQATEMGKAAWVEQLAGKTATAVQMFKTTGSQMSAAFTSIGANATAAGIDMAEQMAVMGTLQATMSGSEAGTKYKAFLSGIGGAQEQLGISLTDANGNMLGMMDILTKLKGKFGDTLDVAESDALKKAFGSDEAVSLIKLLMADTEGLGESIAKLGNVDGMSKAEQMAAGMVDPFDRLSAGGRVLTTVLGQALLPAINPLIDAFADGSATLLGWSQEFPNITRWVGYGALVLLGFTGVLGAAAAASGFMRIATLGLNTVFGPLHKAVVWGKGVWTAYSGSQWLANAALWGFPATWIIAAIVGVVAAVAALIYWWDDLAAAFADSGWSDALYAAFDFIKLFTPIGLLFTFFDEGFDGVFKAILGWFDTLGGAVHWVLEKINLLPGVDISMGDDAIPSTSPSLEAPRMAAVPAGGVQQKIINAQSNSQSRTQSIGKVVITTEGKQDAQSIREQLLMAGA